ncbi:MAG: hypothetical protein ACK6BN_03575 [Pseudanabaena sp.]|jgi:hypothetical protein
MPKTNLSKPKPPSTSPVSLVPDPVTPDLTDILVDRLSDDLLNEIDFKEVSGRVFKSILHKAKNRFFDFLTASNDSTVALNEIEAQTVDIDSKVA